MTEEQETEDINLATKDVNLLAEGLKIAGDLLIPGTSLIAQSDYKRGLIHAGVGIAARVAFGAPGVVLTAANSYCTARTGEGLITKLLSVQARQADQAEAQVSDLSLREKVYNETVQGSQLDDIKESIAEDVEDYYHEAKVAASDELSTESAATKG